MADSSMELGSEDFAPNDSVEGDLEDDGSASRLGAAGMAPSEGVREATSGRPSQRLMITKMVLENFKSYGGIKEIGPFHKCFSAVVGPNGSGKSNVIDAMLFVFGKRAKKLRLNKVSELIHKSDAVKHDPPTFARVSVYFQEIIDTGDGDNDYALVPNTQVVVTRIALKNNSSNYKLNGKGASFKDIAQYLSEKGVDLDNNRFLILQGEVEMISMMPPKGKTESDEGLLEYLEDIIGSSKFVEQTNEAEQQVETLTEVRQEKLNRVKAVEKEKDNLEGAKLEAEALLAKEREIRQQYNILYQYHAMCAEKECETISEKKIAAEVKLTAEREKIVEIAARINAIEDSLKDQREEYNQVHAELKKTESKFSDYERKDIELREGIKHGREQVKKLEQKVKAEAKKEANAVEKKDKATERIPELELKIEELTTTKLEEDAKLEVINEEVKVTTQDLRRKVEAKTKELAPVKQERAVFQAKLDTVQTEIELLEASVTQAKERLLTSEEELANLDEKQQSERKRLDECRREIGTTNKRIDQVKSESTKAQAQEETMTQKRNELLARAEDAKIASQNAGGGTRSRAVQELLNASKKNGQLAKAGILGRLGDLATIPEQYDVAVSTACGMLDHIVVQTTAGAQRCLEYLRQNNLGRVSFIPLDKMKKGVHDRRVETPENAPRLFELITPSNYAITPAVYLGVGNTLVAPDLETATRWAYDFSKRWRVVTMDGKLIETAGTMAGGGKHVRRGGMKLANARSAARAAASQNEEIVDYEELEAEAQRAGVELQNCRQRRRELAEELHALNKKLKVLQADIPKLELKIAGYDTTRVELTKLVPELRQQSQMSKEDKAKRTALDKQVTECKAEMASCAEMASRLEAEVADLQKAIFEAGGKRLQKQKTLCDKIQDSLDAADKSLKSSKVDIGAAEKAITKANAAKAKCEKELEACVAELTAKEKEFSVLDAGALVVMEELEKVKNLESEKRKALDVASKETDELKKSQADLKCVEVGLLGKVDAYEKQISDFQKRKLHWEKDLAKIRAAEADCHIDGDDDDEEEGEPEEEAIRAPTDVDGDANMEDAENEGDQNSKTKKKTKGSSVLPTFSFGSLEKYDPDEIKDAISVLDTERATLAKNANMGAIAEYRKKEADYMSRVAELDEVTEERNLARKKHEELRRQRLDMFMNGFGKITLKLKEMYQMITLGGDAELELVDSLDPFSEGIIFSVRPPKKSWKNISNLSGGEKTLSSLALVFALHHYKPTPLYVMDEIDAALDFKNVSIVANYIKERTKNAQFIIISLRNNMFELADRLVGIYKTNNRTKSITIDPKSFGMESNQNGVSALAQAPLQDQSNRLSQSADVSL